jgi:hypothetical protein
VREDPSLVTRLAAEVLRWRERWQVPEKAPPTLSMGAIDESTFLVLDTRGLPGTDEVQFLTADEARVVLNGARHGYDSDVGWALERKLLVDLDARYVPLVTADAPLLEAAADNAAKAPAIRQRLRVVGQHYIG